ncbi:hypothetical protein ACE1CA_12070 [Aerosakkonemataceae cyanobacterium BLCC-F167]|uniref:Uncharacterized protein n=1 Tax=Floridaenema evergladense BLCC-F167 TaxID=3153639 RepID=A0ABV4WJI6_9CYAN
MWSFCRFLHLVITGEEIKVSLRAIAGSKRIIKQSQLPLFPKFEKHNFTIGLLSISGAVF